MWKDPKKYTYIKGLPYSEGTVLPSDSIDYQMKNPVPGMDYFLLGFSQRGLIDPTKHISYPPEFDDKSLSLKISHT